MTSGRLILLLIASHGVALGLGLALRGKEPAAPAAGGEVAAQPPQRLELSRFIVRIPRDPEEEEEESPEAREKAAREYEEKFARMVEAIPADADVAAIVKATSTDKDKYPATEAEAAYAVWLARDPLAALRWHLGWERERGVGSSSAFGMSERYYLNHAGTAELDRLMIADPEVGRSLLIPAISVARDKGLDQVVALAGSLSQGNNRCDVIRYGIRSYEGLAPHLPALRGMMDEQGMYEFLLNLGRSPDAAGLADAVHVAGFSASAVKTFDEQMADNAEKWRIQSLPLVERIRETKDLGELDRGIQEQVPDLAGWCQDFKGSDMNADEVFGKLKASLPGSEAIEPELRGYLFSRLFTLDATTALDWLRAGQADWQPVAKAVMEKEGWRRPFEEYFDLVGSVSPADAEASALQEALLRRLEGWWERDPENCKAAVQRLNPGPLKGLLLDKIAKEEARR